MKPLLFVFLCTLSISSFAEKPIDCRLDVEIRRVEIDPDDPDPSPFAFAMNATADLSFRNDYTADTLSLSVNYPVTLPVPELGINSLAITTSSGDPLPYHYDGESLKIPIGNVDSLRIRYTVNVPNIFANNMNVDNFLISEFYIYDQRSWYFSSPDMETISVLVSLPAKTRLIPDRDYQKKGRGYHFSDGDLQKMHMVVLAKDKYRKVCGKSAGVRYRLWLHDFKDSLNIDTAKHCKYFIDCLEPANPLTRKDRREKKRMVEKYLRLASEIFPASSAVKNIVECDWRTEKVSGGRCLAERLILADGTFILNGGLLHELLHSFDPIDYRINADSSRFLFSESMIEYLTRYLIRRDGTIESKEFSINDPYFDGRPRIPVFKIKENNQDTQYTIYVYIPWVLDNFAKEIGEEKFIAAYKEFHARCIETGRVRFDYFVESLRDFSVKEDLINNFIDQLNVVE